MPTGTEEYYHARAREYDLVYDKPERQEDIRLLRAWLPGVLCGRSVLEVAAGTGYWTDVYAEGAATVVATDVNAATLEVARARRNWPPQVRFAPADAFDLAAVEGTFDASFAGFFWSHVRLRHLGAFTAGLAARLTQPGIAVFMDNRFVAGSNHPVTRTDAEGNTYQQRKLADGSQWEIRKNFPAAHDIRACLAPITSDVEIRELTYYWTAVARWPGR